MSNKLLCRKCGHKVGTVSDKLEKAIEAFNCPKCGVRTIREFMIPDDEDPTMKEDRLHMTMEQKLLEIMDRDLPHFLGFIEEKYTKEFLGQHFAILAMFLQGGEKDGWIPRFNGTNRSLFRAAHSAVRLLAQETQGELPELVKCQNIMNTLWLGLHHDVTTQGVPDTFYNAFMPSANPPPPPFIPSVEEPS